MTNPLDELIPRPEAQGDYVEWASVTSVDPRRVALDSDDGESLNLWPCSLTPGLEVGQRVLVLRHGHWATILGSAGGVAMVGVVEGMIAEALKGLPKAVASGVVTAPNSGSSSASVYITLPSGRFSKPPVIVVSHRSVHAYFAYIGASVSEEEFSIWVRRRDGSNVVREITVDWIAVGS